MADILDVTYSKLLEWLIDRKKLPEKWQDNLREVKAQVRNMVASGDTPFNDDVKTLLRGDCTSDVGCCICRPVRT